MSADRPRQDAREAMRRRTDRWLEGQLSIVPVWFDDSVSEHTLGWVATQLPLLVAIGALNEDEAADWRARFARVEQIWRATDNENFTDDVKSTAAALLEERLDTFARSEPGKGEELNELQGALRVLRAVRLTSAEEHADWRQRISSAIAERKPARPERPPRPYRAADLQRVVPCPPQRVAGIRLTCLELYGDSTILRWHRVLSREEAGAAVRAQREAHDEQALRETARRFGAAFELHDDLGTDYRAAALPRAKTGGWRGVDGQTGYPLWGASPFVPAVAQQARRLQARNEHARFTIDLQ